MKWNVLAVSVSLGLALATPAVAGPRVALTAGGRTLSGPGTTAVALNATETVYLDGSANSDACATVVNAGSNSVRLTLVSPSPATASIDVAAQDSGALCLNQTGRVDLVCLGVSGSCLAQWRVDRD